MKSTFARRGFASLQSLFLILGFLVAPTIAEVLTASPAHATVAAGDLIFSDYTTYQIYNLNGSTGGVTNLSNNSFTDSAPDVSPDGSRIVFTSNRPTAEDPNISAVLIWAMNSDGSGQSQIGSYESGYTEGGARWAPDNHTVIYDRISNEGAVNLYSIDLNDMSREQMTTNNSSWGPVAFSPVDGSGHYRIAYNSSFYVFSVMDYNGDNKRELVDSTNRYSGIPWSPDWSPDGSRIYYATTYGNRYYSSTDGFATDSNVTDNGLTSTADDGYGQPRVSADGNTVYFSSQRDGCCNLFSISSSGGTVTRLTTSGNGQLASVVKAAWAPKKLAVLGDSYSSGEGNPDFISPSDSDGCHRSEKAYAKVLSQMPIGLTLTDFVACSGATTANVLAGKDGEDPQTDALSSTDDLVILTVGGNDIGFVPFIEACLMPSVGCGTSSSAYSDAEDKIQNDLPGNLDALFAVIAEQVGSGTRVLVVGYPTILPSYAVTSGCGVTFNGDDAQGALQVGTDLNSAIHSAVTSAGAQFEFVNPDVVLDNVRVSPFAGHELCTEEPFFNGADIGHPIYSYHPNENGQKAYAQLIKQYLHNNP